MTQPSFSRAIDAPRSWPSSKPATGSVVARHFVLAFKALGVRENVCL